MSDELKDKIKKLYDQVYNKGEVDLLKDIVSSSYVRYQPPMPNVRGIDAYKKFVQEVRSAYSGLEISVDEVIAEGEKTVTRVTLRGRHTGHTPTIQASPTGKQISMQGCVVSHWRSGKIYEEWVYNDYLGLVQQFGVVPPPGMY